jgi:hypothetical protein
VVLLLLCPRVAAADKVDTLIERMIDSKDYKERLSAALNLSKIADPRAIPAFITALGDTDKTVRGVAAASLGKLINADTAPDLRDRAMKELARVADKDGNAFVRKQAQKSFDALKNLGTGGAVAGAKVYVNIGRLSDSTESDPKLVAKMRTTVEQTFQKQAPTWATRWPGDKEPSRKQLDKQGTTGYHVDGTLTQLSVAKQGSSTVVSCKVSMLIATFPEKSMFGFLKGGASVQAGMSERDVGFAQEDCVVAVVEDLVKRKIIPTIQQRTP